jgi:hypothetical protein
MNLVVSGFSTVPGRFFRVIRKNLKNLRMIWLKITIMITVINIDTMGVKYLLNESQNRSLKVGY